MARRLEHGLSTPPAAIGTDRLLLSVVVPVLNEQAAIAAFVQRMHAELALVSVQLDVEIIFVNDGSTDATEFVARSLMRTDATLRLVNLSRNFGKDAALCAGLKHAKGQIVIPMDVDLQDDPAVIPAMIAKWRAGAKIVNARRIDRSSDGWLKRKSAQGFYRLFNVLADYPIPADVGDFRLLDRQVVDILCSMGERARFNKSLFNWVGFQTDEVTFARTARQTGHSGWTYWRLWNFALDGIFSSSTKPLRVWSYLGSIIALMAFVYAAFIFLRTLLTGVDTPGYSSTVILILLFGGLNLMAIGILGEYIGRIFTEVRARPLYIIRSVHSGEDAP